MGYQLVINTDNSTLGSAANWLSALGIPEV